MNIKEAYNIIGVPETSTDEELKEAYKNSAKKYHPDIYKQDPDKFKNINAAYQFIQDYKANPDKYNSPPFGRSPFAGNPFGGGIGISFDDLFNGGQVERQKSFSFPQLNVNVQISFKESITGINKDISFKKHMKCNTCNAKGNESIGNGCKACNGLGRIIINNHGMIFNSPCSVCRGKNIKTKQCNACNSKGVVEIESNLTVHIPPGTQNNSILRLQAGGNYVGSNIFGDACTDAFICISVIQEDNFTLEGSDVVSKINITLLEALTGCDKEIKTVFDNRTVKIQPNSKHKEEIRISGCGVVSTNGVQRIILNVNYPNDTDDLIKYLESKEK